LVESDQPDHRRGVAEQRAQRALEPGIFRQRVEGGDPRARRGAGVEGDARQHLAAGRTRRAEAAGGELALDRRPRSERALEVAEIAHCQTLHPPTSQRHAMVRSAASTVTCLPRTPVAMAPSLLMTSIGRSLRFTMAPAYTIEPSEAVPNRSALQLP